MPNELQAILIILGLAAFLGAVGHTYAVATTNIRNRRINYWAEAGEGALKGMALAAVIIITMVAIAWVAILLEIR